MDLFRDIKKGKFGHNPKLKREARHELKELGGEKKAEAFEKTIKRHNPFAESWRAKNKKVHERVLGKMKGRSMSGHSHISGKSYKE